jgi:hypothetical protein
MKKKKVTVLASILMCLPFLSLPLMGQTITGNEVRAVKPIEKTRLEKSAIRESGEWPESGKLQLRAAARPWPDSTVTFTSAGERDFKNVYTYDASGNQTLSEGFSWEGGAWINSYKAIYAYDAAGHETLYEYYNWENSQWEGIYKYTNTYDSRGVCILEVQYEWTNNTWVKSSEEHYDLKTVNSRVYVHVSERYNAEGPSWTYLFISGSGLNWAYGTPEESKMEYKATYDANNNLTRVETTILSDGKRVPFQRHILKYSNNNPVSIEVYNYDGNDIRSQATYKATNTYDGRGNRTLSESYSWKGNPAEWTGLNRQIRMYDANGRELSFESYEWDTSSGGWKEYWKYVYTYDANGRELSYESYNRDTSSGGWIESSRTTYEERNEYGDVLLSKFRSWKNGGWEWTGYTVSYPGGSAPDGTEHIGSTEPFVYIYGGMLQIQTVSAGRIGVYTLNGAKVYESAVPAGTTAVSTGWLPKGVLIIRDSSGWAKKVYNTQ